MCKHLESLYFIFKKIISSIIHMIIKHTLVVLSRLKLLHKPAYGQFLFNVPCPYT